MQHTSVADFYIAAVQQDRASAEAIGTHLRTAGYSVVYRWELGKKWPQFYDEMIEARQRARRVIVVLSAAFLHTHFNADAVWWLAEQHQSPFADPESLIGVKVAPVGQPLSSHFTTPATPLIDLTNVPLHTPQAIQVLLAGVRHPGAAAAAGMGNTTYVLSSAGTSIAPAGGGGVDYYMSAAAADWQKANLLALYLNQAGVRVFRLWADAGSLDQSELERRVSEAPKMIVVLSDAYMDDPPWEWLTFGGWGSLGGMWQSHTSGKTLVLVELQDMQMGKISSPGMSVVVIPLHNMGSYPERDERELLTGLGLPAPAQTRTSGSGAASVPVQEFCPNCGAANPTGTPRCFACGNPLVAGAPAGAGSIVVPSMPVASASVPAGATTFCDNCGEPNRPSALYCRKCRTPMSGPVAVTTGTATGLLTSRDILQQRYRIVQQVGKGGFGAVYQVADTRFGDRLLAVKEMSQAALQPGEVAEAVEAFKREALLLAGLMDQHLPRIYDHFSEGGRWYLVMDFIEGETLEDYLARQPRGRLPAAEVLELGQQLSDVLDYLHVYAPGAPLVFRDLKPANIMRTPRGHLYLIDFGIARHFKPGQQKDTAALGSQGYAAPEQYGKEQTTARADLYALGATLHQLLSGDDPSESPFNFRPLGRVAGLALPGGLAELVGLLVQLDKGQRPASAALVKQALASIAAGRGLPAALAGASGQALVSTPAGAAPQRAPLQPGSSPQPQVARGAAGASAGGLPPVQPPASQRAAFPFTWGVFPIAATADAVLHAGLLEELDTLSRTLYPFDLLAGRAAVEALRPGEGESAVDRANLIVPLLSPAFFSSRDCMTLVERAMRRHRKGEALVVPILAEPCTIGAPFAGIIPLPDETQPISRAADEGEAWQRVRQRMRKRMVEFAAGGKTAGRMNLLQWVLLILYGYSYERRFRTATYALKSPFPDDVERTGITIERASTAYGWVVGTYVLRSHTDPQLEALARALGSPDGRPEDILGDAF